MSLLSRTFWTAALERAVKTLAQTAVALVSVAGLGFLDVDWAQIGSIAGLAAVVSILTSIASDGVGGSGPSLANEVALPPTLG